MGTDQANGVTVRQQRIRAALTVFAAIETIHQGLCMNMPRLMKALEEVLRRYLGT